MRRVDGRDRGLFGRWIIGVALLSSSWLMMRAGAPMSGNDGSRWCTVWSLLEKGDYIVEGCPFESEDTVAWCQIDGTVRRQSSKPAILSTLVAASIYPLRWSTGVVFESPRPLQPLSAGVLFLYYKVPLVLFNLFPFALLLSCYEAFCRREALPPIGVALCTVSAAFATQIYAFTTTLNNHVPAACFAGVAVICLARIGRGEGSSRTYAAAGLCAGAAASFEIPAVFLVILGGVILWPTDWRCVVTRYAPAALLPIALFCSFQVMAFGRILPAYLEVGASAYLYPGSYWLAPQGLDALMRSPEPRWLYLFHMTFGHHGVFSLTPILLASAVGIAKRCSERSALSRLALLCSAVSILTIAFYVWNPKARNYGGITQGMRWLFWLFPLWLVHLPRVLTRTSRTILVVVGLAALWSMLSVRSALDNPWSHPWLYNLTRVAAAG